MNTLKKETDLLNQQKERKTIGNIEDFDLSEIKTKSLEDIFEDFKLSDEELENMIKNHANDNFPILPTDPDKLAETLDEIELIVKKEMAILKSVPLTEEEYQRRLGVAQKHAAYKLLAECVIGEDMRNIETQQGLKKNSERREDDNKKTKTDIIKERYPRPGSRQVRDFQHLFPENVLAAINIAFKRGEVVTRTLALSPNAKKKAREDKYNNKSSETTSWKTTDEHFETIDKELVLEKPLHATSLFACIGTGTCLLDSINVHIKVANEWKDRRAKAHQRLHPNCQAISGSIQDKDVFDKVVAAHKENSCEMVFSSPPCQIASGLNTSKDKGKDPRATLFYDSVKFVEATNPKYALFENVPEWLDSRPDAALSILGDKTIGGYIVSELDRLGYNSTVGASLSAADYGVAEDRHRCIILSCKKDIGSWKFPKKQEVRPVLFDVISDLKSLKPGEVDPNNKWHYALDLEPHEILFLPKTPSACSAWDNLPIYQPFNKSGSHSGAQFQATYSRLDWQKPGKTITGGNGKIDGTYTVHPSRPLSSGDYSDCRTLSIAELLRIMSAPDDFLDPLNEKPTSEDDFDGLTWEDGRLISSDEHWLREAIGEHVCPKFMLSLMSTLPIPASDDTKPDQKITTETEEK